MERAYLEWNLANWITVVIMAYVGLAAVAMIYNLGRRYVSNGNGASS